MKNDRLMYLEISDTVPMWVEKISMGVERFLIWVETCGNVWWSWIFFVILWCVENNFNRQLINTKQNGRKQRESERSFVWRRRGGRGTSPCDAGKTAIAYQAPSESYPWHLQASRGSCRIPISCRPPLSGKLRVCRWCRTRSNTDERAHGPHRCRKELRECSDQSHHGRYPKAGWGEPAARERVEAGGEYDGYAQV